MVYLLHFKRKFRHTQHYIGFTTDLDQRVARHASGHGSRLVRAVVQAGITFVVARTWEGDRLLERALKGQKNASKLCPLCVRTIKKKGKKPK